MDKKIKIFGMLVLMIVGVLALSGIASAEFPRGSNPEGVKIVKIEVNGVEFPLGNNRVRLDVERGSEVDVVVDLWYARTLNESTTQPIKGVQIEAFIGGYDHDERIQDITNVFDLEPETRYTKKLSLKIPQNIDIDDDDEYTLVILAFSRDGVITRLSKIVNLRVSSQRHDLVIKDIVLNPENEVRAGRALLGTVRIKNYGEKDEEGIKVTMSIPELGISTSDFIDELDAEESTTSEELYMRIPDCAREGTYQVKVDIEFDDGDEVVKDYATIRVVRGDTCTQTVPPTPTGDATAKPIITLGIDTQDVVAGASGVVYPLTITNSGTASKAYTINVDSAEWANVRVSPSNTVVLQPGETTSMFVYVAAKEGAAPGLNMLVLTASSGGEVLKQIPLKANVKTSGEVSGIGGLKKGLEVGFVVLVILLVILGLIIGFSRLRGRDEEEESRTYY